jgi:hypothetical protein
LISVIAALPLRFSRGAILQDPSAWHTSCSIAIENRLLIIDRTWIAIVARHDRGRPIGTIRWGACTRYTNASIGDKHGLDVIDGTSVAIITANYCCRSGTAIEYITTAGNADAAITNQNSFLIIDG